MQAAPQDFLAHPGNWMQWISDYRGTATAGPNFSWVLATRALQADAGPRPVAADARAVNGAEPVDPAAVEAFVAAAEPFGFTPGGVFPAFGMAEVAIGGTFPPRGAGPGVRHRRPRSCSSATGVAKPVDVERSRRRSRSPPAGCRCSARPVPGLEMRIVDPDTYEDAARAPRRRAAASAARR